MTERDRKAVGSPFQGTRQRVLRVTRSPSAPVAGKGTRMAVLLLVGTLFPGCEFKRDKRPDCGIDPSFYDLSRDPLNCGTCDHVCSFENAVEACDDGICYLAACHPGFVDFDGDASNGCEEPCVRSNGGVEACDGLDNDCNGVADEDFDLSSDPDNCGACDHVCSFDNGIGICSGGQCHLVDCVDGFGDLDGVPANDTRTDDARTVMNRGGR